MHFAPSPIINDKYSLTQRDLGGGGSLTDIAPLTPAEDVVPPVGPDGDAVLADPAVAGLVVLPGRVGPQRSPVGS